MSSSLLGPILAVLFLTFAPAPSQTAATAPASDPQAIALATKALAALTGTVQINDVTLTGTATRTAGSDIETGTITLKALGTTNSRMDFAGSNGSRSEIRTNASGFPQGTWVGPNGAPHAMAGHNCITDAVWFFPAFSILSQASSTKVVATYVGEETRSGESVQHLRLTQPTSATVDPNGLLTSLTIEDVYLDATSFLPVAVLFNTHPDNDAGTNIAVEIDFSDYQSTTGGQAPMQVRELLNNSLFLNITIQSATLNSGLTLSTFSAQ
jgi:hypothetical protein